MSALSISSISRTGASRRLERLPQLPRHDVVGDIVDALVAELAVAQARHRIVLVEALLRLRRRFDMPGDQVSGDAARDLVGEDSLAGARFALDEQRALECDRGVDRDLQVLRRHIGVGALETSHARSAPGHFHFSVVRAMT